MAEKETKAEVDYSAGMPHAHCGICVHYNALEHLCSLVRGVINADMWCKLFKHK